MTRRSLLSFIATAALDPERLLWAPGKKMISIPTYPKIYICEGFDKYRVGDRCLVGHGPKWDPTCAMPENWHLMKTYEVAQVQKSVVYEAEGLSGRTSVTAYRYDRPWRRSLDRNSYNLRVAEIMSRY